MGKDAVYEDGRTVAVRVGYGIRNKKAIRRKVRDVFILVKWSIEHWPATECSLSDPRGTVSYQGNSGASPSDASGVHLLDEGNHFVSSRVVDKAILGRRSWENAHSG